MAQVIYRLPPGIGPRPMQRDATTVAGRGPEQARMNEQARKMEDEGAKTIRERKQRRKVASEAREKSGQFPDSIEDMAVRASDLGDVFRLFPDDPDSFIDDYINPAVMIGEMASGLGAIPYNIEQGNYGQAALAVAAPLAAGAAEQFAPAAFRYLTTKTPLSQAYRLNPWRFQPSEEMLYRGVTRPGYEDAITSGVIKGPDYAEHLADVGGVPELMAPKIRKTFFSPQFLTAQTYAAGRGSRFPGEIAWPDRGPGYIFEVPRNVAKFEDEYVTPFYYDSPERFTKEAAAYLERFGYPHDWSKYTLDLVPTEQARILTPDWLRGYKSIPTNYIMPETPRLTNIPYIAPPRIIPQQDSVTAGKK